MGTVTSASQQKTPEEDTAIMIGSHSLKIDEDLIECYITGIAVTKDGRKIFADNFNCRVKLFSNDMRYLSSLSVFGQPWDVIVTDDQEAVVTTSDKQLLLLQISAETLTVKHKIDLNFMPFGITKIGDKLVSVSRDTTPPSMNIIDMNGDTLWTLSADTQGQELFQRPYYVCSCGDGETSSVIISDNDHRTLTSVRIKDGVSGEIVARRKVIGRGCSGITINSNGDIYVCYRWSSEVALLNEDLSEQKIIVSKEGCLDKYTQAIAYDQTTNQIILSFLTKDTIHIYQL